MYKLYFVSLFQNNNLVHINQKHTHITNPMLNTYVNYIYNKKNLDNQKNFISILF